MYNWTGSCVKCTLDLILLSGGACSGKSTFIKQLRLHYGDGFPEPEREKYRNQVFDNISYAMNKIIDQMSRLQLPYASEKTQVRLKE